MTASSLTRDFCDTCGIVAPANQLIQGTDSTFCPTCAPATRNPSSPSRVDSVLQKLFTGAFFCQVFGLLAIGSAKLGIDDPFGMILVIMLCGVFLTVVHEAGHAVMGKAAGIELVGVVIGNGRRLLARFAVRGFLIELRVNLLGGSTRDAGHSTRGRSAVYIAGGVAAEATVVLWVWFWPVGGPLRETIRLVLLTWGCLDILSSLVPRRVQLAPLGWTPNDGLLLVSLLEDQPRHHDLGDCDSSRIEANGSDVRLGLLLETASVAKAVELTRENYLEDSSREFNRYRFGSALVDAGNWRHAVEVLAPLESWTEPADSERATLLNNLAWAALMTFDEALIESALRWSGLAADLAPVEPAISSTRGSALVMAGRPAEGMPLLVRAYRTAGADGRRLAYVCGFGTLAAHGLGDRIQTLKLYEKMVGHDAQCPIRPEIERRIADSEVAAFAELIGSDDMLDMAAVDPTLDSLMPTVAALVLRWLDGSCGNDEVPGTDLVPAPKRPVSVASIRAAATTLVAERDWRSFLEAPSVHAWLSAPVDRHLSRRLPRY